LLGAAGAITWLARPQSEPGPRTTAIPTVVARRSITPIRTPIRSSTGRPVGATPGRLASSSHSLGTPSSNAQIAVAWEPPASDAGTAGYSFEWSDQPDTTPLDIQAVGSEVTSIVSTPLPPGTWWFHLRAQSMDGAWSQPVHLGPFVVVAPIPSPARPIAV